LKPIDPLELLRKKRNPFLDSLDFDETTVCWDGDDARKLLEKSKQAPLILELGVAGRSVARHVFQNTVLSAQRPVPALKSDAYASRVERDWSSQPITSTAEVSASAATQMVRSKGSLHADKDRLEALIEARQHKRAQMAKDKTSRVTQALGTLALGGGRGRTITSSLMGPGGTERTGRPNRQNVGLAGYENQYVEQLDLVNTHAFVRDMSKVMLREFHRPKLPMSIVRLDLSWQFQIRYSPAKKAEGGGPAGAPGGGGASGGGMVSGSYQSVMMGGAHPGAVSKVRLRTEADLSPTEGQLILVEYCEERPLLQLGKGMAFKIVNYYRGDKSRCPVSKGGGDRPARRKRPGESDGNMGGHKAASRGDLTRFDGPKETTVMDWVGELPKRKSKDRAEKEAIDILPEGVTEILHPKGTTAEEIFDCRILHRIVSPFHPRTCSTRSVHRGSGRRDDSDRSHQQSIRGSHVPARTGADGLSHDPDPTWRRRPARATGGHGGGATRLALVHVHGRTNGAENPGLRSQHERREEFCGAVHILSNCQGAENE
jgi:hypothetical protein